MLTATLFVILMTFMVETIIGHLNYRSRRQPIPENVKDVYDEASYRRWLDYTMENYNLGQTAKFVNTSALTAMLTMGGFPVLAEIADAFSQHVILRILVFLALVFGLHYALNLPFRLYRTFGIEARYGFNKVTLRVFVLDQFKTLLISALLGGGLLYSLLWLYFSKFGPHSPTHTPSRSAWITAWITAWVLMVLVSLLINLLYTKVFLRWFYTLTPLTEGPLYDQILELTARTGYAVREISTMNASKRSTRLNAFFSGFGRFKHIVLYDTLLEKCAPDEVLAVLAHEIGHARHRDVFKNFLLSTAQLGAMLALLLYFLSSTSNWSAAFGFEAPHLGFSLLLFGILTEPLGLLLGVPLNAISRKSEYAADGFAAATGFSNAMIRALKVLARENFSSLTPHPLAVKMSYTHPPVSQRIEALERLESSKAKS